MNKLQNVILEIIYQISNVEGVFDFGNDTLRGLQNYIGRHSLANDQYYVSEDAFASFGEFGLTVPLRRSKLKDLKRYFTYEHPVPKNVVANYIKNSNRTLPEIKKILEFADYVILVTKDEDKKLNQLHRHKMPSDWIYFEGSKLARYESVGIKIRTEKISVTGRILV